MDKLHILMKEMITYYEGDPKRIGHFTKVHSFAKLIGEMEQLKQQEQMILEVAALVHDIGIKPAEEKFGSANGKLQELEGPAPASELLDRIGFDAAVIERVCYLVGHHHTYTNIDGVDYQILVEADFLVNLYEDAAEENVIRTAGERIFKTVSGLDLFRKIYGLKDDEKMNSR